MRHLPASLDDEVDGDAARRARVPSERLLVAFPEGAEVLPDDSLDDCGCQPPAALGRSLRRPGHLRVYRETTERALELSGGNRRTTKLAFGYPAKAAVWNTLLTTTARTLASMTRLHSPEKIWSG